MSKRLQRLIIALAATTMMMASVVCVSAGTSGSMTVPDKNYIYFGSYPQTEIVSYASQCGTYGKSWGKKSDYIVDSVLYAKLKSLPDDAWDLYGDTTLNGVTYRRITKMYSLYTKANDIQYYNWSDATTYHYFKFEPIKWNVLQLEEDDAFLLSDIAIENVYYSSSRESTTWESSFMRSWLNGVFSYKAFTTKENNAIKSTNLKNSANSVYSTSGGNNTQDKVFLLSESEASEVSAALRAKKSSTYVKAMGAQADSSTTYSGNCYWPLRTPGMMSYEVVNVWYNGYIGLSGDFVEWGNRGTVPALHLDLSEIEPTFATKVIKDVTLSSAEMFYTGEALEPVVTIEGFVEGADFEVSYENNVNAGTGTVKVTGIGSCSGTITKTFEIRKDLTKVNLSLEQETYVYNGKGFTPSVIAIDKNSGEDYTLKQGTDYKLSYSNNIDAGTACVTITGIGDYTGTKTLEFSIEQQSIGNKQINLSKDYYVYDGNACVPTVSIDGLVVNRDYEVQYSDNVDAGIASVTAKGINNYKGTIESNFTIERYDISKMNAILEQDEYVQDGTAKEPVVTIEGLNAATDYTVTYSNNTQTGTATATIKGKKNYKGEITKEFRIGKDISLLTASLSQDTYTYDGKEKEPTVTIKGLTEKTDFTVTYSDNINAGTATVTIKGIGDYVGKTGKTFDIEKYKFTIDRGETTSTFYGKTDVIKVIDDDYIYFGNYPQREVVAEASQSGAYNKTWGSTSATMNSSYIVDATLYNTLNTLPDSSWDSNGDTVIENNKYRRITSEDSMYVGTEACYYDWEDKPEYHYFLYEPIKWRILKKTTNDAFVFCETAIDAKRYNEIETAVTWETCTLRSWLNGYGSEANACGNNYTGGGFYETAFDVAEKGTIRTTSVVNNTTNTYGINGGNNTQDKIFLLSFDEICDAQYGFNESHESMDKLKQKKNTTYSVAMGASAETTDLIGYSWWWLRSLAQDESKANFVTCLGNSTTGGIPVTARFKTVVPAMHLNLYSSSSMKAYSQYTDIDLSCDYAWYTGNEIEPKVSIYGLEEGTDYKVDYKDNTNVGTATVIVTGIGDCSGTITKTFEILDSDIVKLSQDSYTYDGTAKEPEVTVKGIDDGTTLDPETDYDVEYSNNVNTGTASATIKFKGNYEGTLVKTFEIGKRDISDMEATLSKDQFSCEYEKTDRVAQEPTVTIEGLTKDVDYTVEYSDNINPGTATVTIKGIGNYTGTIEKPFRIGFVLEGSIQLQQTTYTYDGKAKEPIVIFGEYTEGDDYKVIYSDNTNAGTAKVTVEGIGEYIGSRRATFTIEPLTISNAEITLEGSQFIYYNSPIEPTVSVKMGKASLTKDVDYTVSYSDNAAAGTGKAVIAGIGNYTGTVSRGFEIHKLTKQEAVQATCTAAGNIEYWFCSDCGEYYSDAEGKNVITKDSCIIPKIKSITLNTTEYKYDNTAKRPTATIMDEASTVLSSKTDYTITYENNTDPGTATATITFKGKYAGTEKLEFVIKSDNMLSGNVVGYSGSNLKITLRYGEKDVSTSTSTNFSFDNLKIGDFTLIASADGDYVPREYNVTILGSVEQNIEIRRLGDTNRDNLRDAADITKIARHLARLSVEKDDYTLKLFNADRSEDGKITAADATKLARYLANITSNL